MNDTNRGLNRFILVIFGLLLVAVGGAVALVSFWSEGARTWVSTAEAVRGWFDGAVTSSRIGAGSASWIVVGILILMMVVIVLLGAALFHLGGRTNKAVARTQGSETGLGRITVTRGFASDAIKQALAPRDEIIATRVTSNDVLRQPVVEIGLIPRRGASPRQLADSVAEIARNLAAVTGSHLPTYISIHSSLRAKLVRDERGIV